MSADTRRFIRRWSLVLALAAAAFAAYISLVPFRFTQPASVADLVSLFSQRFEPNMTSRGNFIANVWLFVPIGFLGLAALVRRESGFARTAAAATLVLTLAACLSCAIELLQAMVPGRTPALADVIAQIAGTVIGIVGWVVLSRDVYRWIEGWRAGRSGATAESWVTLLVIYAIGRAAIILLPLDVTVDLGDLLGKVRKGLIVLDPRRSDTFQLANLPDTMADAALAVPIGVLACLGRRGFSSRRSRVDALVISAVWFGLIEIAQIFILSRRADSADWIVNVIGSAVGIWFVSAFALAREEPSSRTRLRSVRGPLLGLGAAVAAYVVYNWTPFDFGLAPRFVRARAPLLFGAPFHGYYVNPEFKALTDIIVKLAIAAPIGLFLRRVLSPRGTPVSRLTLTFVSLFAAGFFSVIELGQVLLPSRYPDNTDILLALAGVAIGWRLRDLWSGRGAGAVLQDDREPVDADTLSRRSRLIR